MAGGTINGGRPVAKIRKTSSVHRLRYTAEGIPTNIFRTVRNTGDRPNNGPQLGLLLSLDT